MSQPSSPDAQDLVLGGQLPPPVSGAVLGGLVGLEQRFNQSDTTQKLSALAEAPKYGEASLPLLHQGLKDDNLPIRMAAFLQLKSLQPSAPELERGLPLRVGDRIYTVYQSSVSYGDDFYYVGSAIDEWFHEEFPLYQEKKDSSGETFTCISDFPEDNQMNPYDAYEQPNLIAHYIDQATAEARAKVAYEEKFGKLECEIYEIDRFPEEESDYALEDEPENDPEDNPENNSSQTLDLQAWIEANQVMVDAKLPEGWWSDNDWTYESQVLMSLQKQKRFSLLRELWQQRGYRPLAFVQEYVIDRPCYLHLHNLEVHS